MKKILYIIIVLSLFSCSDFLKEYSRDLVVVKTPTDLDELMIGSGYLPSVQSRRFNIDQCGAFLNVMDDDLNGVINFNALYAWEDMRQKLYGYTTWQLKVGSSWDNKSEIGDDQTWNSAYFTINTANMVIDELDRISYSSAQDIAIATRVKGEAHFLRAQIYFTLVNIYANAYEPSKATTTLAVPLKVSGYVEYDKETNGRFRRATLAPVYALIVEDLKKSIECLTKSPQRRPLHRASVEAASLLLSRVCMFMQDWEGARTYAKLFLSYEKPLAYMPSMSGVFMTKDNPEILFSQGSLNCQELMKGYGGDFCVSSDLLSLYDKTNDCRYERYFSKGSTDSLGISMKYKTTVHQSQISDIYTLRTAEGYLNMAEACAMLGDAQANTYLNDLRRTRIRGYVDQTYSGDELIRQVRDERRKELCFEGQRWFDIRRYAVSNKLPFTKTIERIFAIYDQENSNLFRFAEVYRLDPKSDAYTLAIPKSVIDFEAPYMIDNPRQANLFKYIINVDFNKPNQ